MHALIKKLHIYLGLINFTVLLIYGVSGLTGIYSPGPEARPKWPVTRQSFEFTAPLNASDQEVADAAWAAVGVPLSSPQPEWALRRDADNNLAFTLGTPNGVTDVTVREEEGRLEVSSVRADLPHYLNWLHAYTLNSANAKRDLRLKLWTWYNEIAIWSLSLMAISGVYLWLASRPRYRWAQVAFGSGCAVVAALYYAIR